MGLLFFGMTGQFSRFPLETLLEAGWAPDGVIVPDPTPEPAGLPRRLPSLPPGPADLPMLPPAESTTIIHLAGQSQIPVWAVSDLTQPETLAWLNDLRPDLIVVACFPYRFPPALLDLPGYGCLNLHPSLLPAYRGPAPLFWQARQAEPATGITLHFLAETLDSGPIVAQRPLPWLEGMKGTAVERLCAQTGGDLLLAVLEQLAQGEPLPRHPQEESQASYFPWPGPADRLIPRGWSARRAFNFIRGADSWPLTIQAGDRRFTVRQALSYSESQQLDHPHRLLGDELWVQFEPGVLRARVRSDRG